MRANYFHHAAVVVDLCDHVYLTFRSTYAEFRTLYIRRTFAVHCRPHGKRPSQVSNVLMGSSHWFAITRELPSPSNIFADFCVTRAYDIVLDTLKCQISELLWVVMLTFRQAGRSSLHLILRDLHIAQPVRVFTCDLLAITLLIIVVVTYTGRDRLFYLPSNSITRISMLTPRMEDPRIIWHILFALPKRIATPIRDKGMGKWRIPCITSRLKLWLLSPRAHPMMRVSARFLEESTTRYALQPRFARFPARLQLVLQTLQT